MNDQLALDVEEPRENPNAWMFHPDGSPRLLLWPGDDVQMMHNRAGRGGWEVRRPIYGCCTAACPICNPDPHRCEFGCCPPPLDREAA